MPATRRSSTPHRIIVTDGEERSALAAVRALGRAGHVVFVCSKRRRSLAAASRYAADHAQTPDALAMPERFVETLAAAVRRWRAEVVLPMTDASMLATLAGRAQLRPAVVPFGSDESYRAVSNKQAVLAAAPRFGIAVPAQHSVCVAEATSARALDTSFPVVVKPSRSVGEFDDGRRAKYGVQYARDAVELAEIIRTSDQAAFPLLLQQRVLGPGVGIFLLIWNGQTLAAFAHRRLREKPPSGGVSVYRESIAADPDLVRRSRALLDHFGWCGVAMIEYKIDAQTGTPYLMEINGRFWGSLQLAVDAGADFPNMLVSTAVDGCREPLQSYAVGVRSRWWWGDVDQLLTRLRRSGEAIALPAGSPTRWQALREFARFGGANDHNEVLRFDDLRPFARETLDWLRRA